MAQVSAADPAQSAASGRDRYAGLIARSLGKLDHLSDIGMDMAEDLPRKAAGLRPYGAEKGEAEVASLIARAYKDVGTTVQRSIAIQMEIIDERRHSRRGRPESNAESNAECKAASPEAQSEAEPEARSEAERPEPAAAALAEAGAAEPAPGSADAEIKIYTPRRRDVIGDLIGGLLRRSGGRFLVEEISYKLAEFDKFPTGVALAKIAKVLDVELDWPQLTTEDWARDEIEARDPRSPFAYLWTPDHWSRDRPAGGPSDRTGRQPDTPHPD
jgi:hypothetical protein